jgi:predicted enzyme related to lactoylglutathione lyase
MITHLKFVGIPVKDQSRALSFYTDKLGFAIATDQRMGPGQRWIELRIAHSSTRVVLFTPPGQEDRVGTFFNGSFCCDDVEATVRQLRGRGVDIIEEPTRQPWGTYAKIADSEGNILVLSSG